MGLSLLLLAFVTFGSQDAAGEAPSTTPLDPHAHVRIEVDPSLELRDVIRQAAAQESGLEVVAARYDEADALQRNARRLLSDSPSLAATHVTDALWTGDGYRLWDAGLALPLWWPGQRGGRQDRARAAGAAASHFERVHVLEVAGWTRRAVAELAVASVRLEIAEAEWQAEDALADQVERAVALEELAKRDLLLARSASLDRHFLYLEALEESRHAEGNYALLTGLSRWPGEWAETASDHSALRDHPRLLLAKEEIARAEAEVQRIRDDQWGHPVVVLGTQHEKDRAGADFSDRIIAGLQIPLGRRKDVRADVAAARKVLAEARRDAARLERELRGALAQAEHRVALADERFGTATEQARMAAEYQRLSERGFGLGETDLATLLRARTRATSAEQTLREAVILRQFSAAELNQALGVVP